jgi:tetratricopeptide (TPR) repeat protein
MLLVRRIATGIVVAAALALLILSVYLLWNARQWDYLPLHTSYTSDLDARAQLFQDKLEIYSRRVNDMESLVIILLGITGLYTIVFILTADYNARSTGRQVGRAMLNVKEQMATSIGNLRELKEEARAAFRAEAKNASDRLDQIQQRAHEMIEQVRAEAQSVSPVPGEMERDLEGIQRRLAELAAAPHSEEERQELLHYETALPTVELFHSRRVGVHLARIYATLARYYGASDPARSHFYLNRAAVLAPGDFETANNAGALAMEGNPPDLRQARKHFEQSLATQPNQQRAKYELARIARSEPDFEKALGLLESALRSEKWETQQDARNTALVQYELACVLAHSGPQNYKRAVDCLTGAFEHPSPMLDERLLRDTEEGGDLFELANTPPYSKAIDELLMNMSVGAV